MLDEDSQARAIKILQAAGIAQAADEPLDVAALAMELETSEPVVQMDLGQLSRAGLVLLGEGDADPPRLLNAGSQYLSLKGDVRHEALWFLPRCIDDLYTRDALLHAGIILVDEFRDAILSGSGVEHAANLVPDAFVSALDERLVMDLYSAAVALMARLSASEPAGCVAEEVMAVGLMQEARAWLEMGADTGEYTEEEAAEAAQELDGIFELFQDDDVLNLFKMAEPADAAVAGHDPINRQLGVVDQRVEAWFEPFGGTAPTGYLAEEPYGVADEDDGSGT
jgi:hypothetical protein